MISDSSDACNYKGRQEADKTTQKQKGECFMRKLLFSVFLCFAMVIGLLPTTIFAQNDATEIYVSGTGNDAQNTGTKDLPFATLAKAVDAAADGATIYVMSDLTMDQCARFYDKSLKITSGEGGPYTITRSADFKQQSDTARSWYNPAMIEVQSSSASFVGLALSDIVLDDAGMRKGTVFAQAVSGDSSEDNTVYVQDAILASNATVPCTVTLGKGAVLRNFGACPLCAPRTRQKSSWKAAV